MWKLVFDETDPTVVTSMSILVEGDDAPVKTPTEVHQPDNIESTRTGILLTEDPGSAQQFPVGSTDPYATTRSPLGTCRSPERHRSSRR